MSARIPFEHRLQEYVERIPWSGCWIWTKCLNGSGYGGIGINGKYENAHRASWRFHIGEISQGMSVLHRCDVRCCINPDHLFLGSQKNNIEDAQRKGRAYSQPSNACKNGHAATALNTYISNGHRYCLLCKRESRIRVKARKEMHA